jgi:hypothetical protein
MIVRFAVKSPLAHGAFGLSAGNATLCRRIPLVGLPGIPSVPCVSGNALRGTLRRIVMRELLEVAGVNRLAIPDTWDRLYAAIANGGHLDGNETSVRPTDIREIREALPPLSVFGAALYSWMLPGHMTVGFLWPRCSETIAAGLVEHGDESMVAEDLVGEVSMCRHIDREHQDSERSGVTPMPTTIEAILPGTLLESSITFADHATEIERSCIAHGLSKIASLGGKSGSGMGAVEMVDGPDAVEPYRAWLSETPDLAERIQDLAAKLAATRPKKAKKA